MKYGRKERGHEGEKALTLINLGEAIIRGAKIKK